MTGWLYKFLMIKTLKKIANSDFIQNITRDLKSIRVLFVYASWGLFTYCVIYVLKNVPEAASTVIVSVSGVVSVVFTNYVFSKNSDKKLDMMNGNGKFKKEGK